MVARIYFETSAWNSLNRLHPAERDRVILALKNSGDEVFASVITAAEILKTNTPATREALCGAMIGIHGKVRPLLDRPHELAEYAAKACLSGEDTIEIRESSAAALIRSYLENPASLKPDDQRLVEAWVLSMDQDNLEIFRALKSIGPREGPKFCTWEVLESAGFNRLFMEKAPLIGKMGLTEEQLVGIVAKSDIWKAYRGLVAFTLDAAIDQMPATRPGGRRQQKRPGGPDVLQAAYLGVCDIFVVDDAWLRESLTEIAAACGLERRIVSAKDFLDELSEELILENLRALGVGEPKRRLPLPRQLAEYIAGLEPEDLERIRHDVGELKRLGLLPPGSAS